MAGAILEFAASALVVVVAGVFLAGAADRIADLTGLGRLLVGSVLLAGATSLPELSVDVSAARAGHIDLAVGDLMGSCLANLAILAAADLWHTSRGRMLSRVSAAHALSGAVSMVLAGAAGLMILARFGVRIGPIGLGSLVVFVVYLFGVRIIYVDQRIARRELEEAGAIERPAPERRRRELTKAGVTFGLAAAAILAAAPFVADSAARIAEASGLGGTFIGTTLVAFSTSLPELVSTFAAVRMRSFDLAVGNIFGSNAFNMAMLLPVDLASREPLLASVSEAHAATAMWVMVITAVVVAGQLYHAEKRRRIVEPDALMVLFLVGVALWMVRRLG